MVVEVSFVEVEVLVEFGSLVVGLQVGLVVCSSSDSFNILVSFIVFHPSTVYISFLERIYFIEHPLTNRFG